MVTEDVLAALAIAVGQEHVSTAPDILRRYGIDGTKRGHDADVVVWPDGAEQVSAIMRAAADRRIPVVPRGAGTGYSGGAIPVDGGIVVSMERMNRLLEIDEENLVATVEPNVVTGDLQDAVERVGLFYPPDPASLRQSVVGGNVAECAGGPRAFKYGTTGHYVLGLQAVLPTGEIIETGGKVVKDVVGYDLTHLIVGSEGTLAVVTRITLRLVPKPPVQATLRAMFGSIADAAQAVTAVVRARVVPATLELVDRESLEAVSRYLNLRALAPEGTAAMLLIDVDGQASAVRDEVTRVSDACRTAGALEILEAHDDIEREELWRIRRELSPALRTLAPVKINNDIVVPKGRIPRLFGLIERLRREYRLQIPCFGHAGDGNVHVNIMVEDTPEAIRRGREAERRLFEGVLELEGSVSGEHGIGSVKRAALSMQLGTAEIALMKRLKAAFDPLGILNPGKIFP